MLVDGIPSPDVAPCFVDLPAKPKAAQVFFIGDSDPEWLIMYYSYDVHDAVVYDLAIIEGETEKFRQNHGQEEMMARNFMDDDDDILAYHKAKIELLFCRIQDLADLGASKFLDQLDDEVF